MLKIRFRKEIASILLKCRMEITTTRAALATKSICAKVPVSVTRRLPYEVSFVEAVRLDKRNTSSTSPLTKCWHCEKKTIKWRSMLCEDCGHIQDVNTSMNYFDLFDFPKTFKLEPKQLTTAFRNLQTMVHPDKYISRSLREKEYSEGWSTMLNKAYKTLYAPAERGRYLLQMHGVKMPKDNSVLDQQFLLAMMERNEEVERATSKAALTRLNGRVTKELEAKVENLAAHFEAKKLKAATSVLVEMQYLLNIQTSIKEKLLKNMGK